MKFYQVGLIPIQEVSQIKYHYSIYGLFFAVLCSGKSGSMGTKM